MLVVADFIDGAVVHAQRDTERVGVRVGEFGDIAGDFAVVDAGLHDVVEVIRYGCSHVV